MSKFRKLTAIITAAAAAAAMCGSVRAIINHEDQPPAAITPPYTTPPDAFSYDDTTSGIPAVIVIDPYTTANSDTEPPQTPPESDTSSDTSETPDTQNTPDTQSTPPDTQETPGESSTDNPPDTSDDLTDIQTEPPLEIFLTYYTFNLEAGKGAQLLWSVPNATERRSAVYYSDNTNVARIDSLGYIMAVGPGTARVTVVWDNLLSATATVYVSEKQILPEYIVLGTSSFNMKIGETAAIKASILPEEISELYPLSFYSNDTNIASVDENGIITATGTGETDITVYSDAANLSEKVHVTVSSEVAYNKARLDGYLYDAKGKPMVGSTVLIDSLSAVTDRNGYFVFEQADCRDIIIRLSDNPDAFCGLTLTENKTVYLLYRKDRIEELSSYEELAGHLAINNVSFVSPSLVLTVGEVYELAYSYEPKDASVTAIEYSSSNVLVAPVGQIDGVVTAKSPGEAVITLTLNGGQTMTVCTITINPKESTEYSAMIAFIETAVLAIIMISIFLIYRVYRRKVEKKLMEQDDENDAGDLHDIEL